MNAIETTVRNRRIEFDAPDELPDGTKLMVDIMPASPKQRFDEFEFMTEEEQSDDPAAIEKWIAEVSALPPLTMTAEEEAGLVAWRKKSKEFNLEAVRRQMEDGIS